jgi:hypothetical protein
MSRRLRSTLVAGALTLGLVGGGVAVAATSQPAIKTFTPKSERQITNIDVLRQQIRNYYGDPLGTGEFDAHGNYAREASYVALQGTRWLSYHRYDHRGHGHAQKAIRRSTPRWRCAR